MGFARRALLLAVALAGCQAVEDSTLDAARPPASTDGATGGPDGGPRPDADLPPTDSAPPLPDRGALDAAPPSPDAGPPRPDAVAPPADAGPPRPDAQPPLPDASPEPGPLATACSIPWNRLDGVPLPDCVGRAVIEVAVAAEPSSVDVAVSGEGRALVGYTDATAIDAGGYALRLFDVETLALLTEGRVDPFVEFGELAGYAAALTVQRETFHVALWLQSDAGSQVQYAQWRADDTLSPVEVVDGQVGREGDVDVAVASNGDVHVAWHDSGTGRIALRSRSAGEGAWGPPDDVDTDLQANAELGTAVRVAAPDVQVQHIAYQHVLNRFGAAPAHRAQVGGVFNVRRTLDNVDNRRHSGVGLGFVVDGDRRVAAYVDWVGGTGELRLAHFRTVDEPIEIEVLVASIPLVERPSRYPLALRIDRLGLLHLAAVVPTQAGPWALRYWRQTRLGGTLSWVVDTVDDDVPMRGGAARVDLFVDDDRRPHIAWFDVDDGTVYYARLDPNDE